MLEPAEEVDIMRRIGEGDPQAYRLMVDAYLTRIYQLSYQLLKDQSEAEEIAQETFLRLWKHAADYRPTARVTTWLHRIAHNLCIDRLRRRREVASVSAADAPDSRRSVVSQIHEVERSRALQSAIDALPERQRTAIQLIHYQGLSAAQAASVMGVKVPALESLLARGRRQLKQRLSELVQEGGRRGQAH